MKVWLTGLAAASSWKQPTYWDAFERAKERMVTLNFSFTEIPTSFYEKSDQLIGFCVLELV